MKHSIFAPKELRDPSYIDSFRGIYMPYWAFYISQKGSLSLNGKKTSRRGDYIITDHYALTGDLDAYYKGLSYDASSSFDDNISEELAPYNLKGMKAFTPAYLSGFYADTSDVDAKVYQGDAEYTASAETTERIASDGTFAGFTMDTIRPEQLHTKTETIDSTMFPVWFLSYRQKDRVAYATVIEKHFTLDKQMEGPDHRASLEPQELARMVAAIRHIEQSLGDGRKRRTASEEKNCAVARKSIVAKCAIAKGDYFTEENLTVKRPGTGISPMKWYEVLGMQATRDYEADERI